MKTAVRFHYKAARWLKLNGLVTLSLGDNVEQSESAYIAGGSIDGSYPFENYLGVLTKAKCGHTQDTEFYTWVYRRGMSTYVYKKTGTRMFRATGLVETPNWKQAKSSSIGERYSYIVVVENSPQQ